MTRTVQLRLLGTSSKANTATPGDQVIRSLPGDHDPEARP